MSNLPVLLDYESAAEYLGTPEETIRAWVKAGLLPVVKLGGQARSRVRFRRVDLDEFINSSVIPARIGPLAG